MCATQASSVLCVLIICVLTVSGTTIEESPTPALDDNELKLELFNGVHVAIPHNDTEKLISFHIDTNNTMEEGRGKKKKLMQRILPLFIMPFLIQSTIVPLFLSILKFMLVKSLMIGKLALVLIIINAFKNHNSFSGRQDANIADVHYGYHGNGMEYGAYINK